MKIHILQEQYKQLHNKLHIKELPVGVGRGNRIKGNR